MVKKELKYEPSIFNVCKQKQNNSTVTELSMSAVNTNTKY